jgi:hypothetical protein
MAHGVRDARLTRAQALYDMVRRAATLSTAQGFATLNRVMDVTPRSKFLDALSCFESAADLFRSVQKCAF